MASVMTSSVKSPDSVAEQARSLGAKFVMCAWIPHTGLFNIDNAKKAVDDFNRVGQISKRKGTGFLLPCTWLRVSAP